MGCGDSAEDNDIKVDDPNEEAKGEGNEEEEVALDGNDSPLSK